MTDKRTTGEPNLHQRIRDEMKLPLAERERRYNVRSRQLTHLTRQRHRDPWEPACDCALCRGEKGYWEV